MSLRDAHAETHWRIGNCHEQSLQELARVADLLERHYQDMQDIEFTIENGKLWMLQTRTGKRTGFAAVRIAVDMVGNKLSRKKPPCCGLSRIT